MIDVPAKRKNKSAKKLGGYTLLELTIVIAILALLIPAIMGLVIQISRLSLKWQKMLVVKNDAFQSFLIIKNKLRDEAVDIDKNICFDTTSTLPSPTLAPNLQFLDKTGLTQTLSMSSGELMLYAGSTSQKLHSSQSKFANFGNQGFRCLMTEDDFFDKKIKIVNVNLDIESNTINPELVVPTIHLQTNVRLRQH